MIIFFLFVIVISVVVSLYIGDLSTFVIPVSLFLLGQVAVFVMADRNNRNTYSRLFGISYVVFLFYATICYIFMREHNFSCLLVTDTITSYIPAVEDFMRLRSLRDGVKLLYGSLSSKAFSHAGIILFYWASIGKFGSLFGSELYFNLQVSILFLSAFVPVFIFRLLSQNGVKEPFKYSLVYVFCSVFFYYSTLILRDAPIALFYVISFSYLFTEASVKKNVVFVLMIALSFLIRPQNGFFLLLFYLISLLPNTNTHRGMSLLVMTIAGVAISYISLRLDIIEALESNAFYAEKNIAQETEGIINALDGLPPVISDFSKVIYIHVSPIPSWLHLGFNGINVSNNIMAFPRTSAVIYNFIVLGAIIFGLIKYREFRFSFKTTMVFLAALLYLLLQTSSTEQRRIMICYPILFLFSIIVFQSISVSRRRKIVLYSVVAFVLLQGLALMKGI